MKKSGLCLALLSLSSIHALAEIPVVEKPLSAAKPAPVSAAAVAAPTPQPAATTPAAVVTSIDTSPSAQWELYQQIQQLQQEVRNLRGQLETQNNQIERLKQDARSRYMDLDQRLTVLQQAQQNRAADSNSATTATGSPTPANPAASSATTPTATTATTPAGSETPTLNPDDEKKAYFAAYEVFRSGGPNKAIAPMRNFIKTYPQSTYTPTAYYWLGEFYLAASPADVTNARKCFRIVTEQYPDSPKVASALYKLASMADGDNKTTDAIRYLQEIVRRFASSPEAAQARVYLQEHNASLPEKGKTDSARPTSKPATAATADTSKPAAHKPESGKPTPSAPTHSKDKDKDKDGTTGKDKAKTSP